MMGLRVPTSILLKAFKVVVTRSAVESGQPTRGHDHSRGLR